MFGVYGFLNSTKIEIKKEQRPEHLNLSLKFYFNSLVLALIIGYPVYFLVKSGIRARLLSNESNLIRAVVVAEKKYVGHSSVEHRFY